MAASLSPGSHTAPDHLVTSIFCSTLRGFCCHCHLDRQGELCSRVAAEHGLSRILSQGCEMRKESPLTPIRSTDSTPVLFRSCCWLLTELLLPPAHICRATNSTGKMAEINLSCCLLAFYAFFFSFRKISGSDKYICALQCHVFLYKDKGNVWLLQLPSPDLPLALPTCASSLHQEHAHAPIQTHSNY